MTTSTDSGAWPVIIIGLLAALVAGVAIAYDDRVSALWASASLFGAAGWLAVAGMRRLRS